MHASGFPTGARLLALTLGVVSAAGCGSQTSAPAPVAARTQALGAGPDFTVTEVSGPTAVSPGSGFNVSVTVCNTGTDPAPTNVDVVLSTDTALSEPEDTVIASTYLGTLSPGQCASRSLPANGYAPNGGYFLGAIVDPQGQVPEGDETNNARVGNALGIGWGADFVVTALSGPPVTSGSFTAQVTVCNQGNQGDSTNVDLFLSPDQAITPNDAFAGGFYAGYLSPGQCVTQQVPTSGPPLPNGAYFLGAIADSTGAVPELIESNNAFTGPRLGYGNGPDLVVTDLTAPPSVVPGPFTASVTVCNQGTLTTPNSSSVELHLSPDATVDASDAFAGSAWVQGLSPGQCVQLSVPSNTSVPSGAAYYLGAIVDPGDANAELLEDNNVRVGAQIGIGSQPDLIVTDVVGAASATPGGPFSATATVCNQGTAPVSGVNLEVHLSVDPIITSTDPFVGVTAVPPLQPGQCAPLTLNGWANAPDGAYFLGALVDPANGAAELNENNNTRTGALVGVGYGPDFVITALQTPPSLRPSGSIITATVCNQGTGPGSTPLDLFFSSDTTVSDTDFYMAGSYTPYLSPGQCADMTFPANVGGPDGAYYVIAVADRMGQMQELIETNNTRVSDAVGFGNKPDFVVTSIDGPPTASSGPFDVTFTVCNQGTLGGSTNADLFVSSDKTITSTDQPIGSMSLGYLEAGQCSVQRLQAWANFPPGAYYLGAIVDAQNQTPELIETNNALTGPLLGVGPQPDLVVTAITAPPSAAPGNSLVAQVTVCNQGQSDSPNANLEVRLSADSNLDTTDWLLGGTSLPYLSRGQCTTVPVNGWVSVPDGTWFVGASVDPQNYVAEIFETNNTKVGPQIGIGNMPDYVVTGVTGPQSATSGASVRVSATVCNQGTLGGGSNTVQFQLSTRPTATPTDFIISSATVPPLAPSQCAQVSANASVGGPDGVYYVVATADAGNWNQELNESNNVGASAPFGIGNKPDFVVTAVSGPKSARPGDLFPVKVTLCNQGTVGGATDVQLVLSSDATISSADAWLNNTPFPFLDIGQCSTQTLSVSTYLPQGAWYLGAIADMSNRVQELLETNNARAGGQIGIGNAPDFIVTSVVGPPSAYQAPFNVTATVCNQGTQPAPPSVDFFLSTDTTLSLSDPHLVTAYLPMLNPGQCVTQTVQTGAPVPPGPYYVGAIVDASNLQVELLESNNAAVGNLIGIGSQPDLLITSVTAPPSVVPSGAFTTQLTVCNQGQSQSAPSSVDVRLSPDATLATFTTLVGSAPVGSLAPGQCNVLSVPATANVSGGSFYVGAVVDPNNNNPELFENNNVTLGGPLGVGNLPDFVIASVSGPTGLASGSTFTANVRVCNQGTAPGSAQVDLFLSSDTVVGPPDAWAGGDTSGPLNPGACVTRSIQAHVNAPDGAYYLSAAADLGNSVFELNENNNTLADKRVAVGSYPDLTVTSLSAPGAVTSGSTFPVTVMACNQGLAQSNSFSVNVVLSADAVITATDTVIGNVFVPPLPPGQCYGFTASAYATVPDGAYTLGAIADAKDENFELLEDNNTFAGGTLAVGNGPDYSVAAVTAPSAVRPNSPASVQVTYCNQGTASGPSVPVTLFLSQDAAVTPADAQVGSTTGPGLAPNQCATVTLSTSSVPGPDGTWFLGAIIDPGNQVYELNHANDTGTTTLAVDSVPPAPPSLTGSSPASPSNSRTPTLLGTTEPNAKVSLYPTSGCSGSPLGTGQATASGSFAVAETVAMPINAKTPLYARATDVAGNLSACSTAFYYTNDSIAPARPTLVGLSPTSPSKSSTTPTVRGNAEPASTLKIYKNAVCTGTPAATTTADASGNFSATLPVTPNAGTTFFASATDPAGNTSTCSPGLTYVHDSIAPNMPTMSGTSPSGPSNSNSPFFVGMGEAFATAKLYSNATCTSAVVASGTVNSGGQWTLQVSVASNATTTLFATITDAAGNVSPCSAGQSYVNDASPPIPPALTGTSPTSPSSSVNTNLVGSTEGNATVQIFANGTCTAPAVASGQAAASGLFGVAVTVAANSATTFSAQATDPAGNVSACSSTVTYVHDSTAPAVPVLVSTVPASPSNASTTPTLKGTAEPNSTLALFTSSLCSGSPLATAPADATGAFSFSPTVAANSTTTFFVTATDGAGNVSPCSAGLTYQHDATAPTTPVISSVAPTGTSFIVRGTAEAGATVSVFSSSTCSGTPAITTTASANSAFSATASAATTAVTGGTLATFFASATDPAKNVSTCSAGQQFLSCSTNRASCDGNNTNGCEVTLTTDPLHCGSCTTVCGAAPNAVPACNSGVCAFTCKSGFSDCDGNAANGCETAGACQPACSTVDANRELLIRDPLVVDDPLRTKGLGAWTFGKLMTDMAGGQNPSAFVRSWLETWKTNQVVNGFVVQARPNILNTVITPWENASGVAPGGVLDLSKAPFRLLAIVNRVDLRNLPNNAGEGRFVFGVLDPAGNPLQFTVILEYKLPGTTSADVIQWAKDWHALGQTPITDPTFNTKLQALTDRFAGPNLAPTSPNGSAIGQVRSNEITLAPVWQLREWVLGTNGLLQPTTVKQTPDASFNNSATLASFINQNQASILAGTFTVPTSFNGANFLGANADVPNPGIFWNAPGLASNDARQQFSLNTCSGCHGGETQTQFLHIAPRGPNQPSQLSDFLTGLNMPKPDPVSGVPRTFGDLARRATDLQGIACGTVTPSRLGTEETSMGFGGELGTVDSVPASNLPPSRVH